MRRRRDRGAETPGRTNARRKSRRRAARGPVVGRGAEDEVADVRRLEGLGQALAAVCRPVAATTSGRSVVSVRVTFGLTGVTNGSPWFGRSKGLARLTHGIQRYRSTMPLARVNSQSEPLVRCGGRRCNRLDLALAPAGRTPPSGTTMV